MPMPPQMYTAKLEDKIVHNEKYIQYMFELVEPHELTFQAGQYVSIQVTDQGLRRSYSIVSSPDITHGFELLLDIEPWGPGSQCIEGLKFGDTIKLLAPLGLFTLAPPELGEEAIVLIATGSGIAPFKSMLSKLLQLDHDKRPISLIWGMRYANQLFWLDDFAELARLYANFTFMPTISKATPEWTLSRGRVTDILAMMQLPTNAGYYICGNDHMVIDAMNVLTQRGVVPQRLHHEKFT